MHLLLHSFILALALKPQQAISDWPLCMLSAKWSEDYGLTCGRDAALHSLCCEAQSCAFEGHALIWSLCVKGSQSKSTIDSTGPIIHVYEGRGGGGGVGGLILARRRRKKI